MIIGISGKKQSGKDTVGELIQLLIWAKGDLSAVNISQYRESGQYAHNIKIQSGFEIKKFAEYPKNIVCMLIGCTREQLEDEEFKNTELGEEWWLLICTDGGGIYGSYLDNINKTLTNIRIEKLTPRKLLQLVGTECGRNIIHPNIWVNSTMSGYQPNKLTRKDKIENLIKNGTEYSNWEEVSDEDVNRNFKHFGNRLIICKPQSKWIITDVRFPNELKAIKDRGGFIIRVNKKRPPCGDQAFRGTQEEWDALVKRNNEANAIYNHPSETALDDVKFQYIIDNNGTLDELIEKVKEILIKEKII